MRRNNLKILILIVCLIFSVCGFISPVIGNPLVTSRTYTLDADFDEGVLVGVEHDTVNDQLQLSKEHVTLPFIWIPNNQGTVSKVNTETGEELGRYWVSPDPDHPYFPGKTASPSRTTVDLQGNCWVGCRDAGTVVKIGLFEGGIWDDRNGDGVCQTSQDENNDGNISDDELLPWGEDECVLFEVNLFQGYTGTHVPGTYPGPYDIEHWRTSPRGLAIDADNNLWAGTCPGTPAYLTSYPCTYYYIDGETGDIKKQELMSGHAAYGAVIDENGILWSSHRPTGTGVIPFLVRFDPSTLAQERIYLQNRLTYGLGLDYLGQLFVSGWSYNELHRVNINRLSGTSFPQSSLGEWTKGGPSSVRGVACTGDNDVWLASSGSNKAYRYDNNGNLKTSIYVGIVPTGVAIDAAGKVWVCNDGDEFIKRIDPATNAIDLEKEIIGSNGHYSYSDMTGIMARTITTRIGTWTVNFNSEEADTPWGTISWNSLESEGTPIIIKVRSSNDQTSWSSWEEAFNGDQLSSTPDGQYLQIETTLQTDEDEVSPILYDLTVEIGNLPPVAEAGGPYVGYEGSEVIFDASGSSDPDGTIILYEWDFDEDGVYEESSISPTKVFTWNDDHLGAVNLRVTDDEGASSTDTVEVIIHNVAPIVTIDNIEQIQKFELEESTFIMRDFIKFTGMAYDPGSDVLIFIWDWGDGTDSTVTTYINDESSYPVEIEEIVEHTYNETGEYTITLTVEDDDGGIGTDESIITIWGPKDLKKAVILELESAKTGFRCKDFKINLAIKQIEKSLNEKYWIDLTHLDSRYGIIVFIHELIATSLMERSLNISQFESVILKLMKADELLAKIALEDAENTPVKNPEFQEKIDCYLAKAYYQMIKATESVESELYKSAILHYMLAWGYAQSVIKWANKECLCCCY